MPGHTRLYRRGAVYYHRAAIPKDIADTYPKAEETFSLKTKDHAEALRRVRIEAVRVDVRFAAHRRRLEGDDIRSRDVPLHRELVRLGFWEFTEDQTQAGQTRLFGQLKADASGYFSGKTSEAFSTYLKQIGVKTPKTSFHSFRHTFKDACRAYGVEPYLANALLGHAEEGTGSVYGAGGYGLPLLKDAVDKVGFRSLRLDRVIPYCR